MILHIEKLSPLSNRLTEETCQAALHTSVEAALLELNLSSTWNVHYQCSCWFLSFLAQWRDRGIRGELLTRNSNNIHTPLAISSVFVLKLTSLASELLCCFRSLTDALVLERGKGSFDKLTTFPISESSEDCSVLEKTRLS